LAIDYRKTEAEQGMLLNLHKRGWTEGLKMADFEKSKEKNVDAIKVSSGSAYPFTIPSIP
jgi:26S proteasome regulatory subunit N11